MSSVVFVTGANGGTGRHVANAVLHLAPKHNLKVKVGVRNKDKAKEFTDKGVEVVEIDFDNHEQAVAALKGTDRVWITAPNPAKNQKAFDRTNIAKKGIDAAKAAGVRFVLFGSVAGAEYEAITFAKEFRDVEKHLEKSGLAWTFLRMAAFVENVVGSQHAISNGVYPQPLSKGFYAPISLHDVGDIAAIILADPAPHIGKAYTVTGPEALTGPQQAAAVAKVVGRDVKHVNPGPEEFKKALAPYVAPYQIDGLLEMYAYFENVGAQPSPDFAKVTGRKQRTYEESIAQLHKHGALK